MSTTCPGPSLAMLGSKSGLHAATGATPTASRSQAAPSQVPSSATIRRVMSATVHGRRSAVNCSNPHTTTRRPDPQTRPARAMQEI